MKYLDPIFKSLAPGVGSMPRTPGRTGEPSTSENGNLRCGEAVLGTSAHLRIRISPDIAIGMGMRVKTPSEQMADNDAELTLTEQAADDMPPYERLLGDAMRGLTELFSRQDVVESQWRAIEPILGNVTQARAYEPGTWGPEESNDLIAGDGQWIDPAVRTDNSERASK